MRVRLLLVSLVALGACSDQKAGVFTLYRSSVIGADRVHVATFDARDGASYNRENCEIVRGLMASQPGVAVSYWCSEIRP
jgi:hypothetical protein